MGEWIGSISGNDWQSPSFPSSGRREDGRGGLGRNSKKRGWKTWKTWKDRSEDDKGRRESSIFLACPSSVVDCLSFPYSRERTTSMNTLCVLALPRFLSSSLFWHCPSRKMTSLRPLKSIRMILLFPSFYLRVKSSTKHHSNFCLRKKTIVREP